MFAMTFEEDGSWSLAQSWVMLAYTVGQVMASLFLGHSGLRS
jgi:hypothetical protein